MSIPKEDDRVVEDDHLPQEESEMISHITQSEGATISNTQESEQA